MTQQDIYTGEFTDNLREEFELFQITAPAHLAEEDTDLFDTNDNELRIWIRVDDQFRPDDYTAELKREGWKVVEVPTEHNGTWKLTR